VHFLSIHLLPRMPHKWKGKIGCFLISGTDISASLCAGDKSKHRPEFLSELYTLFSYPNVDCNVQCTLIKKHIHVHLEFMVTGGTVLLWELHICCSKNLQRITLIPVGNRHLGRGLFLEPPTVFQRQGRWLLQLPVVYDDGVSSDSASSTCAQLGLYWCH